MTDMRPNLDQFKSWYQKNRQTLEQDFFTFLSFPSISTDPAYQKQINQTAQWLSTYLKNRGLDVSIWETSGHPVVFASYLKAGPDRPTLLIYQHYDVQPVDPIELWDHDPFKPVIKNNQVYARGASDNKGQCFYSISAVAAFLQLAEKVGVNIKIFIEGEEESQGGGTFALLPTKARELKADHLLIVDGDIPQENVPGITLGMRGIVTMHVECKNASKDLHSGIHGGIALNPNRVLATLLSKLWDESGKVTVPGFYDAVRTLSSEEKASLDLTFDEAYYKKTFGVNAFACESGYSPAESGKTRPTLEINGMSGGYTGPGFKTVIPAKANAKISCRLVPDQNPQQIGKSVSDFLKANVPQGIELTVRLEAGSPSYRSKFPTPIAEIAAKAYEEVFGKPCKRLLSGGNIPIVELAKIAGAEAIIMGTALAEDDIHAPNEHFGLDRLEQGFLVIGNILARLNV